MVVSPVLVGRRPESAVLSDALARVLADARMTVVVGGEAGVAASEALTLSTHVKAAALAHRRGIADAAVDGEP